MADCAALLAAKSTLEGATGSLNWSASRGIGSWDGVVIGGGRAQELNLSDARLGGTIPAELGNLGGLQSLYLDSNQLTGRIPEELSNLSRLSALDLSSNRLTGTIPAKLGDMDSLVEVYLDNNRLTGSIPAKLGEMDNLYEMYLGYNRLSGAIPAELGNLTRLYELNLINNRLTGKIPAELGDISTLRYLYLSGNNFTGCIPDNLSARLGDGQTAAAIGIPFCADATPTATPSATATPTPSATPETGDPVAPIATATRTPVPTATATRVPAAAAAVLDRLAALERQVGALTGRIARLEAAPPAATPTATPTPLPCLGAIRAGAAVSGTWAAGCVTSHPPASNPGGTYYARFYTFTLDGPSDVTITLSSADASPHLLLLRGAGTGGGMIHEASPFSVDPDTDVISISDTVTIRASLDAGRYTIEATTYYTNATGDFRLRLDAEDASSVDGANWRRGRGAVGR